MDSLSANFAACIPSHVVYYQWKKFKLCSLRSAPSDTPWAESKLFTKRVLRTHRLMLMEEILDTNIPSIEVDIKPRPIPNSIMNLVGHGIISQTRTCVLGRQIGTFFPPCHEALADLRRQAYPASSEERNGRMNGSADRGGHSAVPPSDHSL